MNSPLNLLSLLLYFTAADRDVDTNEKELLGTCDLQDNTVLHMATRNNDVKTAELCLEKGADVDCVKCGSVTALHMAATKGNLEVADLLISRGADVNKKDGHSKTPLHRLISHFRVPPSLCFKTRVGAQPLIWKSFLILMQIKHIFTRKIVHLASI